MLALVLYALAGFISIVAGEYDDSYVSRCFTRYGGPPGVNPLKDDALHHCNLAGHFRELYLLCQFPDQP